MAITLYDLPVTGREEDVADQLAAYILLTPGDSGKTDRGSSTGGQELRAGVRRVRSGTQGTERGRHGRRPPLTSNASTTWSAGSTVSDPTANADMVGSGQLPEERAEGCEDEWKQLSHAWSTLLDEHWR